MKQNIVCIECPQGCCVRVEIKDKKAVSVNGFACPKGEIYALSEVENPMRIVTSTVGARGLALKMIPVRTDNPIPKEKVVEAMRLIRGMTVFSPVKVGDILCKDFIVSGVNVVVTRDVENSKSEIRNSKQIRNPKS